jgi:hypothetical protein
MDGATTVGSATLGVWGNAVITTSTLSAGTHQLTAVYGGDGAYAPETSPAVAQVVTPHPTATTVTSSLNPSHPGQSVSFTATVATTAGGPVPTGSVTLFDGSTVLGSGPLGGAGKAIITTALTAGTHSLTVVYGGDSQDGLSSSAPFTQTVSGYVPFVSLTSSANPSTFGQLVTFTAHVTKVSGQPAPTGTVTISNGATVLGTANVGPNGYAVVNWAGLPVGTANVTATYGGDGTYAGASSPVLHQTVSGVTAGVTLTSSGSPSADGATVTFTGHVERASGAAAPTGTMDLLENGTPLTSPATVDSSGDAVFDISTLAPGSHDLQVVYYGDSTYAPAQSTVLTQVVDPAGATLSITPSATTGATGDPVTFTVAATVPAGAPAATGIVQIQEDGRTVYGLFLGDPPFTFNFELGDHVWTAIYEGDANYPGSTVSVTITGS